MALISGKYWTGDFDIKPEAWGSFDDVQAAVRENADSVYGINPNLISFYLPCWEKAGGLARDYSGNDDNINLSSTSTWTGSGFNVGETTITFSNNWNTYAPGINEPFTIFIPDIPLEYSTSSIIFFSAILSGIGFWVRKNSYDNSLYIACQKSYTTISMTKDPGDYGVYDVCVTRSESGILSLYANDKLLGSVDEGGRDLSNSIIPSIGAGTEGVKGLLWLRQCLSKSQIGQLRGNKYGLLQPIARRSYFIPDVDIGITLVGNNLNANSFMDSYQLNLIKLLNPSDVLVASNVTDSILSGLVNIVQGNDVSVDSLITTVSVQAIRKLIGQEISSITQITDVILSTAKQVNLTDLESLTEITNVVFSVIRKLSIDDVNISSEIVNISIDVVRFLLSNDVNSSSDITSSNLTQIKNIVPNNLISLSTITDAVISLTGNTTFNDPQSQTEITSVVMSVLRQLKINDLTSDAEITFIYLNAIKRINFNEVSSISQIESVVISTTESMNIDNLSSTTSITQAILSVFKGLTPINVSIESDVINPAISVLRKIFSNTINISSSIDSVGMSIVGLTVTGKVSVTFSMAVPGGTFKFR